MATAAQKAKAKSDRTAAVAAMKAITKKGSKAHLRAIAKVKRLAAVMQEPTQSATDHAGAKSQRDIAKVERTDALTKMQAASGADRERYRLDVLAAESRMRVQGDIMRDVTGRAKGKGTTYIGPATEAGRAERGLPDQTDWQKVNQALKDAGIAWSNEAQADMYKRMFGTGDDTDTDTDTDTDSGDDGGDQTGAGGGGGGSGGGGGYGGGGDGPYVPKPRPDREPSFGLENWWADEQYNYADWLSGVQGGNELNQWDPMGSEWTGGPNLIPKGKYGMKRGPSSYLEQRGIGHNLAYKPWMPTAWSPSSDVDEPYKGVPGSRWTTYRQLQEDQGLTNSRPEGYINPIYELLYHYGGKKPGISGRATPQVVPGDWKPQTPPGGPAVYPLSQVPLFSSGRLSAGYNPSGGGNPPDDDDGNPPDDGGGTPPDNAQYGPLLSAYTGMSSATPGGMWRITGEPEKVTINPIFGSEKQTYQLPLTYYGGGNDSPFKTTATRLTNSGGWNPDLNTWNILGNRDFDPGQLQLANWSGAPGSYSGTPNFQVQSGLNFLGSPSYTHIQGQNVPFLAQSQGGPVGSTTQGPLGSGAFANWSLPELRGLMGQGEPTGDVVGYDFPQYYTPAGPPAGDL